VEVGEPLTKNSYGRRVVELSVVIPVFNEEGNLKPLYTRLTKVMRALKRPYEIIFVDDGSSDRSFQILKDIHNKDERVKVVRFTRNFGQHPAIMAGFNAARGEIIITLDADLQNPPEEIPKLIEKLDEGCEVVFGVFQERKHSAFRRAGSRFSKSVLARVLPVETTNLSGFRALRSYAVGQLKLLNEKSKFLDGLLCWMGYKVGTVEVEHDERYSGKTKYTTFKLVSLWLDMVISFTDFPLKISTVAGLLLGILSLLLALFYLIRYFLYGFSVPGFATTAILIAFFSGVQLFSLGILGEYMGRVNRDVKNKPEYIVRDRFD
jgi:glycosyltransferase involved in cell wall biosynthesis